MALRSFQTVAIYWEPFCDVVIPTWWRGYFSTGTINRTYPRCSRSLYSSNHGIFPKDTITLTGLIFALAESATVDSVNVSSAIGTLRAQ